MNYRSQRCVRALCRFFLAHAGPQYLAGEHAMLPFLFDMPKLYEMFVAEWLRAHEPPDRQFQSHWNVSIDSATGMRFDIDIMVRDQEGRALAVVDTKYKVTSLPDESDVHQILAYALSVGAKDAVLVYPLKTKREFKPVGGIRLRALGFSLQDDLDDAGRALLVELLEN